MSRYPKINCGRYVKPAAPLLGMTILFCCILSQVALGQLTYQELRVAYDSAWTFKNLQLVPVKFIPHEGSGVVSNGPATPLISMAEALLKHKIKLQEIPDVRGADVNWLQVDNHSKQDVVIQSGEILDGGKQDRMVGDTKVIAAGTTDYIHVYCVEKRRWTDKAKEFTHAGIAGFELQKTMHTKSRQSEVWKEIDRQFKASAKQSETFSYLELNNHPVIEDTDYVRFFEARYAESDSNFAGFIFITGDRILSTELFATAVLTRIAFPHLLTAYVRSAKTGGALPKVTDARKKVFMDKILKDEVSQKIYVSSHGKLQMDNGKVIHLVAYDE